MELFLYNVFRKKLFFLHYPLVKYLMSLMLKINCESFSCRLCKVTISQDISFPRWCFKIKYCLNPCDSCCQSSDATSCASYLINYSTQSADLRLPDPSPNMCTNIFYYQIPPKSLPNHNILLSDPANSLSSYLM